MGPASGMNNFFFFPQGIISLIAVCLNDSLKVFELIVYKISSAGRIIAKQNNRLLSCASTKNPHI